MKFARTAFFYLLYVSSSLALFEGDDCVVLGKNGGRGKCINLNKCKSAKDKLKNEKIKPQTCGFSKNVPLVCCRTSIQSFVPKPYRSEEKCQEYHDLHSVPKGIAFGEQACAREFPHMAALGYKETKDRDSWLCGGSLISDKFVLTAAHCTNTAEYGNPKWARFGDLNLNETTDEAQIQDIKIASVFMHPNYTAISHYHDIALLKLKESASFDAFVRPACIYARKVLPSTRVQATGWGKTDYFSSFTNHLMKVYLNVVHHLKCRQYYSNAGGQRLKTGIDDQTQICAGGNQGEDTCPGDSGGPLQFLKNRSLKTLPHYVVVGITSFGKACGTENSIGVYTRVSYYRQWIENIVWPI